MQPAIVAGYVLFKNPIENKKTQETIPLRFQFL